MKSKKAQTAIEFVVIFGMVLLFFIAFFAVIQSNIEEKNQEKKRIIAQNIGLGVQDEINLAAGSSEGYYREFYIPKNIIGYEYEISIEENFILISGDKLAMSFKIPLITGSIKKEINIIQKKEGIVYLN